MREVKQLTQIPIVWANDTFWDCQISQPLLLNFLSYCLTSRWPRCFDPTEGSQR